VFRDLLDQCYVSKDFEFDQEFICGLCRCTPQQLDEVWPKIRSKFPQRKNGRHFSQDADRFRNEYEKYLEKQRRHGSAAHAKRRRTKDFEGPASGEPVAGVDQDYTTPISEETKQRDTTRNHPSVELAAWRRTRAAILGRFPTTYPDVIKEVIVVALLARADITDVELAELIPQATAVNQRFAGMYRTTLPGLILSLKDEEAQRRAAVDAYNQSITADNLKALAGKKLQ
jgi:hypothetical protein